MSLSATSSKARAAAALVLGLATAVAAAPPAAARVFLTDQEALALAFPGCRVERATVYLTEPQLAAARAAAGVEIAGAVFHPYRADCPKESDAGTAYFDTHRVRTLPETLMVVVDREGQIRRVEVLVFREPVEYLPRGEWYGQFRDRRLDPELGLQRAIRGVTGASLTARATTEAVRRVLAVHAVIAEPPPAPAARGGKTP